MQELNFIIGLISSTLDTITFLYIMKFLFCSEINISRKVWIWCGVSQLFIKIIEKIMFHGEESLILMVMFPVIIIFLSYGIIGLKKIIYIFPTAFIMLLPGLMISLLYSIFFSTSVFVWLENSDLYWATLLDVIIMVIINRKIRENYFLNFNKWDIFLIISANILSLIIVMAIDEFQKNIIFDKVTDKLIFIIISFITISMDIFTVISIIKSKSAMHYKNTSKINEYYMEIQLQHFEAYKNSQKETRRLKHDMKNHLICINDLCSKEKYSELSDYVKTLQDSIGTLDTIFNTGNSIADSIINEKYSIMEKNHISFELKGLFGENLLIKPVYICTIFANAIDNAIEACIKIEEISHRRIDIEIKNSRNFLVLSFRNSIKEQLKIKDNKIKTSKQDEENHGFGLENIRAVVNKYKGNFEIKVTKDIFELEIVLPN